MGAENKAVAKGAGGRPSDYGDDVLNKSFEYLHGGFKDAGDVVPSVAGLACYLGKSRRVMYTWADAHAEFMHMLDEITTAQERMLVNGGLLNAYNPTISKLMMAKHGYSDKIEQDVTSNGQTVGSAPTVIQIVGVGDDDSTD